MKIIISNASPDPIYEQIVRQIRSDPERRPVGGRTAAVDPQAGPRSPDQRDHD
jgi:hypothetical protein